MKDNQYALGHLAMLTFSVLIAGSFSFGNMIAHMVDPTALMAVRFFISGVIIGTFVIVGPGFQRVHFRAPWRYILLGGLFAIYFVTMFEGLKTATPLSASAVFTLTPIMSAVFGYWLLQQITTRWMALAIVIGAGGALWVIFNGDLGAMARFEVGRGEAIYFFGCIAHALYTPLVRKLNRGEPTMVFTFGMIFAGWLILTVLSAPEILRVDWLALPRIFWIGLFYLAICASSVTFFLLQFAAMQLPSANVMAYTYLAPSWVIVWELALGHAGPPVIVSIGVAVTVVALLMLLRRPGIQPR
ncbi:MAG: DMT family transporter [Rhodobacteraceae bacterium]|nr:DMT family transporter [Paracoccaceae bacterium]